MVKLNFYNELYDVSLCEPKMIKAKINQADQEYHYFTLNRESYINLYKLIGVKYNESKTIFNVSEGYWNEFISKNMELNKFNFNECSFITAGEDLMVSIFNKVLNIEELKKSYNKLISDLSKVPEDLIKQTFDLDTYLEKIVITTNKSNEYNTVVIIENDYLNSSYSVISGLYVDKMIWPHSAKSLSERSSLEYLMKINLEDEMNLSVKFGEAIYKDYKFDGKFLPDINLSLNELFTLLKHINVKVEIDKDKRSDDFGLATELSGLPEGNLVADEILDSINNFDIPVGPLMRLQALKKSFKDSKISFQKIMWMLTMEYTNIAVNIRIDTLTSIKTLLTKHSNDATIIRNEVDRINKLNS